MQQYLDFHNVLQNAYNCGQQEKKNKSKTASKKKPDWGDPPAFGADMRAQEYSLRVGAVLLNNGSWGVTPNKILDPFIQ